MIKRYLAAVALACALVSAVSGQNTTTFGNIVSQGTPCGSSNCVYYQLPAASHWVSVAVTGTWTGTLEAAVTSAPNANYSNLDTLTWTAVATETVNGTWTVATTGYTYLRVRATSWTGGAGSAARVAMDSTLTQAPLTSPIFPGPLTATGLVAPSGGSSSNIWRTDGSSGPPPPATLPPNLTVTASDGNGNAFQSKTGVGIYANPEGQLDSEGSWSAIYGIFPFGDSNCLAFGITGTGVDSWAWYIAQDLAGGNFPASTSLACISGNNAFDFAGMSAMLSAPADSANAFMPVMIGTNDAGVVSSPAVFQSHLISGAVWNSTAATDKYQATSSGYFTASGGTFTQPQQMTILNSLANAGTALSQPGDILSVTGGTTAMTLTVGGISTGSGVTITTTTSGGALTAGTIVSGGTHNFVGSLIAVTGQAGCTGLFQTATLSGSAVATVTVFSGGTGCTNGTALATTNTTGPVGGVSILTYGAGYPGGVATYATTSSGLGSGVTVGLTFPNVSPMVGTTTGSTLTSTSLYVGQCQCAYVIYPEQQTSTGTWEMLLDGTTLLTDTITGNTVFSGQWAAPGPVNLKGSTGGGGTANAVRFAGISQGNHTFTWVQMSNGPAGLLTLILPPSLKSRGSSAPNQAIVSIPPEAAGANAGPIAALNATGFAAEQILLGDGLKVAYVDTTKTVDINRDFLAAPSTLYPNCGSNGAPPKHGDLCFHFHIARAIEDAVKLQGIPASTAQINLSGTNLLLAGLGLLGPIVAGSATPISDISLASTWNQANLGFNTAQIYGAMNAYLNKTNGTFLSEELSGSNNSVAPVNGPIPAGYLWQAAGSVSFPWTVVHQRIMSSAFAECDAHSTAVPGSLPQYSTVFIPGMCYFAGNLYFSPTGLSPVGGNLPSFGLSFGACLYGASGDTCGVDQWKMNESFSGAGAAASQYFLIHNSRKLTGTGDGYFGIENDATGGRAIYDVTSLSGNFASTFNFQGSTQTYTYPPCTTCTFGIGLSLPIGTPTFTAATGASAPTCVGACTNTRGKLSIVATTATTGTIGTLNFSAAVAATPFCAVSEAGDVTWHGLDVTGTSTTLFNVTAAVTVASSTVLLNYVCLP